CLQIRNRLKSEFGIMQTSVSRELALRKLDPDVRVQVESNHEDFKKMLGYQPQLDFSGAQPTKASEAQQPTEAELADKQGFKVEDAGSEGETMMPEQPEFLRRSQKPTGVIERQG